MNRQADRREEPPPGGPAGAPSDREDGPQDTRVDRRQFLRRMGALSALAATARAAGASPLGASARAVSRAGTGTAGPAVDAFFRRLPRNSPSAPGAAVHPMELTAWELGVRIRDGDLRPSEVVEAALERIRVWDGGYLAFNAVTDQAALARARELDRHHFGGLLHGIPVGIKDNFQTAGVRTTANSWIFQDFVPEADATVVARLREAGAVMVGKTQMGPLATTRALTPDGEITTVSAWAPDDPSVNPGGSSTGSATAVAGRMIPAATGTQTGGSITVPALSQGLTGVKPTMGRVSLRGVIPLTYTRDHPGPLARDARDAALLLQAMAGPDAADPRTLGLPPVPDYLVPVSPPEEPGRAFLRWPTRIGVLPGWADRPGEVGHARRRFLRTMEELGVRLVEVALPPAWEELTSPAFNDVRLPERSEPFLEHLRRDVRLFGVALSPWINGLLMSGDEYLKGQRAKLALLRLVLDEVFRECDVVVQDGHVPFDMIGLPLIAFPVGMIRDQGRELPTGVLLGGLPFGEQRLLSVAAAWQWATDWHTRRPPEPPAGWEARVPGQGTGSRGRLDVEEVAERAQ